MTYSLRRVDDGAGDSGGLSCLIKDEAGKIITEYNAKPKVGYSVQVGSITARTFGYQDYWVTTPVTEILEEKDNYVRFRTRNSEYEWESF